MVKAVIVLLMLNRFHINITGFIVLLLHVTDTSAT